MAGAQRGHATQATHAAAITLSIGHRICITYAMWNSTTSSQVHGQGALEVAAIARAPICGETYRLLAQRACVGTHHLAAEHQQASHPPVPVGGLMGLLWAHVQSAQMALVLCHAGPACGASP